MFGKGMSRVIQRAAEWLGESLANRFSALALMITLVIVVPLGAVAYGIIHHLLSQKIEAELRNVVALGHYGLEQTLRELNGDINSMARRSLVTNAIGDSEGRDAYLLPFLREFVAAEPRIAAISIHDYKGRAQVTVGSGRLLEDEIQPLIEGVITGECTGEDISQERIMTLATHDVRAAA